MSEESCGNCRFFHGYPGARWDGTCRKSIPVYKQDCLSEFPPVVKSYWCGEWRGKDASCTTGKLYQLPNGQWITAADVSAVLAMDDKHRYCEDADGRFSIRVGVFFKDGCGNHIIPCNAIEAAEAMRDKIAADVNAMVGGAA